MNRRSLWVAALVSCSFWYVGAALAVTGHTKVLWGAGRAMHYAQHYGSKARATVHRIQGDRGAYIEHSR